MADRVAAAALARLALLDHVVAAQRLDGHFGLRRVGRIRGCLARRLDRGLGRGFGIESGGLLGRGYRFGRFGRRSDRQLGLGARGHVDGAVEALAGDGLGRHFRRWLAAGLLHRNFGGAIVLAHFFNVGAVDPVTPARLVVLRLGLQALLLGYQPFAVGDGDLVVVGVDFREGQEAVAVAAILHEGRLQ